MGLFDIVGNIIASIPSWKLANYQIREGKRMLNEASSLRNAYQRPEMFVPESIQSMTRMAQGQMYQRMPGMPYFENQLQQMTASALKAIQEGSAGSEGLGALSKLFANQMQGIQNMAAQESQWRSNAQANYMNVLNNLGKWEQQAWQWNKADPYLQAMEKAAQLEQIGYLNKYAGMANRAGTTSNMLQGVFGGLDEMLTPDLLSAISPKSQSNNFLNALFRLL